MGQYIGARYVPRFMGTYDATQTYEALDVVDNGMGTSYIAKIPVTAGIPLTNTTYWALYGASSGAIVNLQQQIDRLDSFGDIKGKTIAVFGASNELASYTQGANWVDDLETILDNYATVVNKSVASRGIIQAISDYISDPDRADYDIVIFCCTKNQYIAQTQNDLGNGAMEVGNISSAIASLATYKTLDNQFFFASCTPYADDFKAMPMACYDSVIKRLVEKNGYSMLDMHSWLGVSDANASSYTYDTLHFKAEVAPVFAKRAIKALLKGNEPFANYASRISGSSIASYTGFSIISGLDILTSNPQYNSFLECDVNGKCYGQLYLVNNTGSTIAADTDIITMLDATPSPFMLPWFNVKSLKTLKILTPTVEVDYSNRTRAIRVNTSIASGEQILVTWGQLDSWTQSPS